MTAPYQLLPDLTSAERHDLAEDIAEHGVQIPIVVDESGRIIDGHHRQAIADELDVPCPRTVVTGYDDAEKRSMALRLNLHRRSLTREQKRELITASLTADPELSDRQHAERTGASPTTIGTVREHLVDRGMVSNLDTRVGVDGVEQPAAKPSRFTKVRHEVMVNKETGEVVDTERHGPHVDGVSSTDPIRDALNRHLSGDVDGKRLSYQASFARAVGSVSKLAAEFDHAEVAALIDQDEIESLARIAHSLNQFIAKVRERQVPGLRVVGK